MSIRIQRAPSSAAGASATPLLGVHVRRAAASGTSVGSRQQRERERLEARLARDLRLRAALRLVGQVEIFEPRLGLRGVDRRRQLRRQLALLVDALQDRGAPLVELAQVVSRSSSVRSWVSSSPPVASLR